MKQELIEIDNREYVVYKHTTPNNKVYIGITCQDLDKRWKQGLGYQTQQYFFKAIVKYGWINIKHEILYTGLSIDKAKEKEVELITQFNSTNPEFGYNITPGGDSKFENYETRVGKLISEGINKGKIPKIIIPKGHWGKAVSKFVQGTDELICKFETTIQASYDANMVSVTFQHRMQEYGLVRVNGFDYKYTNPNASRFRAIAEYDIEGNLLNTYQSICEAARTLHISFKNISACCRGHKQTYKNRIWRYINED